MWTTLYYYMSIVTIIKDIVHVIYCINLAHTCMLHVHVYIHACMLMYTIYYCMSIVTIIKDIVYIVYCINLAHTCMLHVHVYYIHALYDSVYQLLLSKIAVYSVNLAHTCMLP